VRLPLNTITQSDALDFARSLPDACVDLVVTSPPYALGLRNYGVDGQWGSEATPEEYVEKMTGLFREVRRCLKPSGVLMLNLGDTYWNNPGGGSGTMTTGNAEAVRAAGRQNRTGRGHPYLKPKDLVGVPWLVAFALQQDGWYLRGDYIWFKTNPLPESVTDRCTKAHEYLFHLTKSERYWWDQDAIRQPHDGPVFSGRSGVSRSAYEPNTQAWQGGGLKIRHREYHPLGRNRLSVWKVATEPVPDSHFATFPQELIRPAIRAGCPPGGLVYDPFMGSGTTAIVALQENRNFIGSELNPEYIAIAEKRIARETGWMKRVALPLEVAS
jgi:DNA modification methylase